MPKLQASGAFAQALDDNARALNGAYWKVYAAGTTTQATTYSNALLTIANAWPVIGDAAGRIPDIYVAPGNYRIRVETAGGVLIAESDNNVVYGVDPGDPAAAKFGTVALLKADETMGYTLGGDVTTVVAPGDIVDVVPFRYVVLASGASAPNLTTAGGVKLRVELLPDGFFPLEALGPDNTGATDITPLVEIALSASSSVQYPAGTFRQSDVAVVGGKHIRGVSPGPHRLSGGTLINVGTNNAAAFMFDTTAADVFGVVIENIRCQAASGVTGARFLRQTSKEFYLAYFRFLNIDTYASLEVSYDIWPIFMVMEKCLDGYYGTAPSGQTHQAMRCLPASFAQARRSNLNTVRETYFFRSSHPVAGLQIAHGDQWHFNRCDFELFETQAFEAQGVYLLDFDACWFEKVGSASTPQCFTATQGSALTGTRQVVFRSCYILPNAAVTRIAVLGSASQASFEDTSFIQVPSGCVLADNTTRVNRMENTAVLSGDASMLTGIKNKIGNAESISLRVTDESNFRDMIQDIAVIATGLADAPASPETIATITIPVIAEAAGQVVQCYLLDLEAVVMAVQTTTTNTVQNRQKLGIFVQRAKSGSVTAGIVSSGNINLQNGGGAWTSEPVWNVAASGDNLLIQMTSNPGNGAYTGGIRASLTGRIHTAKIIATFDQPVIA